MANLLGIIIFAALSYAAAAVFSDNISMDLSKTVWSSGWTYAAWAGAYAICGLTYFAAFLAAALLFVTRSNRFL